MRAAGVAVIAGCHLNALDIAECLQASGWSGSVVFLLAPGDSPGYVNLLPGAESRAAALAAPDDLLEVLRNLARGGDPVLLLLTDERFHTSVARALANGVIPGVRVFLGVDTGLERVLDRYLFYRFVAERGLCEVPRTVQGTDDPEMTVGLPFVFRFRFSWAGLRKLERVRLVQSRDEWAGLRQRYLSEGFRESDWCFQEYLSPESTDNVSVCGWHEGNDRRYHVTRAVLRWPPLRGTAVVVEAVEGHDDLVEKTAGILSALEFRGPFEMEYVRDARTGAFKVIELNPRFWLQHRLAQERDGYEISRRYTGSHSLAEGGRRDRRYWVSSLHALRRLVVGDLRVLPFLCSREALRTPGVGSIPKILWEEARLRTGRAVAGVRR